MRRIGMPQVAIMARMVSVASGFIPVLPQSSESSRSR